MLDELRHYRSYLVGLLLSEIFDPDQFLADQLTLSQSGGHRGVTYEIVSCSCNM